MEKLTQRLKESLSRRILDVKSDKLDEHYITSSRGSFTRREMAYEIENETEVGIQQMESILHLTLHLLEKGKENI